MSSSSRVVTTPISVWQTACQDPAIVLCIQLERRSVAIGYNQTGWRRSVSLTRWIHSQPDLLDLYDRAFRLYDPRARQPSAAVNLPSACVLLRLDRVQPAIGWANVDDDEDVDRLLLWIDSRPELADFFLERALSLAHGWQDEDDA